MSQLQSQQQQSQSQQDRTASSLSNVLNAADFPNYDEDQELLTQFLQEHQIQVIVDNNSNNNNNNNNSNNNVEDHEFIPTAATSSNNIARVPCYPPLLQRIKQRRYEDPSNPTFVVELPLSELVAWDAIRGMDLAIKCTKNTLRYQSIICSVLDQTLEHLTLLHDNDDNEENHNNYNNNAVPRDFIDILHDQRVAQQQAMQNANQQQLGGAGGDNQDMNATGGVLNDGDNNNNNNNNNNNSQATEEFPPLLMRRYELRILPLGRRGTMFPFTTQYHGDTNHKTTTTTTLHDHNNTTSNGTSSSSSSSLQAVSLRLLRSRSLGRLVTMQGMVVRASDVKPACVVATYTCDACGVEVYQVVHHKRDFLPQRSCPSPTCTQQGRRGTTTTSTTSRESLHLQTRGSKFVKFQELKVQELPSQVPMGHVPRSMTVHCRGELTRLAGPGDVITLDGIFLPQRLADSGGAGGYRAAMRAGLISTTYMDAMHIHVHKKSFDESLFSKGTLSEEEAAALQADMDAISHCDDPMGALASAIAPEIFGHEDIKRSLVLQLVGGCTRTLPDGMRIRGDINICLMGDPGVAKSQLLKHVASMAPRGVYTTGKGSSGVGLTAAVTKDLTTGDMALEGGALVLADRGICAIDEFDKMDESDRTAIHEVMEQQTVSIAKAGIVATLNARAAVLAAANPLYGRYNRNKSLSENINLPNSLLSRFDLMYLILDTADVDRDLALARHVTFVHQNEGTQKSTKSASKITTTKKKKDDNDDNDDDSEEEKDDEEEEDNKLRVTPRNLREYIARARQHHPVVPHDVAPYIVEAYVNLRLEDRPGRRGRSNNNNNNKRGGGGTSASAVGDQTAMTARQLLSILRLAQALARLRFSDYVAREDVDEAIRLTHMSKASLHDTSHNSNNNNKNNKSGGGRRGQDVTSKIYTILRDYAMSITSTTTSTGNSDAEVDLKMCEAMVLRKGYTTEQLWNCLEEYEELSVLQVNSNRTHVHFL